MNALLWCPFDAGSPRGMVMVKVECTPGSVHALAKGQTEEDLPSLRSLEWNGYRGKESHA